MSKGDILKLAMAQEHVCVRDLADKLFMSEVTMHRYLSGYRKINDDLFKKFADAIREIGEEHRKEFEEGKKQKKYRWHDLRKNPDDLPKEDGFYIACVEHPKNHTRRTREIKFSIIRLNSIAFWERNNIFVNNESVIAWREIEPFEEVEE